MDQLQRSLETWAVLHGLLVQVPAITAQFIQAAKLTKVRQALVFRTNFQVSCFTMASESSALRKTQIPGAHQSKLQQNPSFATAFLVATF